MHGEIITIVRRLQVSQIPAFPDWWCPLSRPVPDPSDQDQPGTASRILVNAHDCKNENQVIRSINRVRKKIVNWWVMHDRRSQC